MTRFDISVVSDTVCPWCYVGKNRLDRAIAQHTSTEAGKNDTFSITWLPYYLNPNASKVGVDKLNYYKARFGEQRAAMMHKRVTDIGKEVGIHFSFGGKTGSTRDSHRLIQMAKTKGEEGSQTKVVEALFKAYFEEEQDITSHQVLEAAGVKAGLAEQDIKEWLESDAGGKEVDQEVTKAQTKGISGVPDFTLQGQYKIGGAQDEQAFLGAFATIKNLEGMTS